jgi:Tol biopolymer transport system component
MRVPHGARPPLALSLLAALLLAGCGTEQPTEPPAGGGSPQLPPDLQARAIAVRVDVAAGTVTPLERTAAANGAAPGMSFALVGANEVAATTSNFFRSAVGQFIAKKVRIRFDVALTNRTTVALMTPTFPTPPAGTHSVMLFPFSTTLTAGNGAIDASTDWNGEGTPGSGAALNFFNDASCSSGGKSDCYRWEGFPAPFAPGTTTGAQTVGFDVDPTVQTFVVYFVLAADLPVSGSIAGTVTSPQRGPLGGLTVTLSPANRFATTSTQTGGYGFTGLAAGSYTLSVSGLPAYCDQPAPQPATVSSGGATTVDFSVACPYIAFTSDRDGHHEIYRMNADGSDQTRLTNSSTCWNSNPAWSPDGTKIAFQCLLVGSIPLAERVIDIIVMNADGSGQVNLTHGTTQNQQPDWSPDGRIGFSSHRDGNDDLYVMNADGSNPVRLTQTPDSAEFYPSWSPDGSRITFSKMPYKEEDGQTVPSGNDDIWSMKSDGTDFVLLYATPGGTDRDPAWSPTGDLIAFWSTNTGCCPSGEAIFLVNAIDKTLTQITSPQTGPQVFSPEWSSDGSKILVTGFGTPVSNGLDVMLMQADGTGLTNLTNHAGQDTFAAWQP